MGSESDASGAPAALSPGFAKPLAGPYAPRGDEQDLVPARMINEVLYCERLMYLEWVQGEWADNVFTADGKAVHRRVDRKAKVLKPPVEPRTEDQERPYSARSVWLSSKQLGITAKIDVVEVEGGSVVPVEYKRGKQPDSGPYLPEKAQLAAQVLLLREHGYECEHGEIYYAGDRRRVAVAVDDYLVSATVGAVARARDLVADGRLPPPLEDSPKCRGCSLAGICLPDETRALRNDKVEQDYDPQEVGDDPWGLVGTTGDEPSEETRVRRLYPARDDKVPLYVQDHRASMRLVGERLVVTTKDAPATEARLNNMSSVNLYGNVHVTTPALRRLMQDGIPVAFYTYGGWFVGRTVGADPKNVELRLAQYRAVTDSAFCLSKARCLVASKILNCRTLLRRNHSGDSSVALGELRQLARKARETQSLESLLGIEGTAARAYFQSFAGMLKGRDMGTFEFERRNRRPPTDPVNAMLSFCYGMLTKACAFALASVGLDPLLGFYHQPHFGRPSLALDLMEEFRPVIADSVVISAINNGVIQAGDFVTAAGSVALTGPARKRVVQAFERRMDQLVTHPVFDYRISYRRLLEVQARLVSRLVLGELDQYPEFRVR